MTPQATPEPTTRKRRVTAAVLLCAAVSAFVAFATPASASPDENITICHATGSDSNPYVSVTIAAQAVVSAHIAHQHTEDIIPVFTHAGVTYSQNLDAEAMILLAHDCKTPTSSSSSSTTADSSSTTADDTSTTSDETTTADSSSTTDDNSTEVPFFTSGTALVLGLGGALASTFVMLRRRL